MTKNKNLNICWMISGILGLVVFILFFNHAFPVASIDIRLDKQEVIDRATSFLENQGFELKEFQRSMLFDSDYNASVYLQKTQGIKKSNELIKQGIPVWFWSLRWFKELNKEGFYCSLDPATGHIVYFAHFLLDDAPGANLAPVEARKLAEAKAKTQGIDLAQYDLKENNTIEQKNRTDYHFVWEKKDYAIQDAHLRIGISIYGDKLGYFNKYLDIPEEFTRNLKKEVSFGQVLSIITTIFMFFLFIAAMVMLIIQFKKDKVNWRFGLVFGLIVTTLTVIDFFNSIPLLWNAYPDTISKSIYIAISAGGMFIGALLIGLIIFLFGSSGESVSKEVMDFKMPLYEALKNKNLDWQDLVRRFLIGYSLAFLFLGYITLFYLIGTRFFHIWMPPEAEYSNILGTSMPFLFPLTVAISAAISEEFMFRLFSISFLKKFLKFTPLAVIIPAFVWAFAHSNYPVFPAYVRGIELTIAGIIFGVVFLKYGLETVIIAHFVIDATLIGLPLLKSSNTYFMISGIIVMLLAFLPLPVLVFFLKRKRGS